MLLKSRSHTNQQDELSSTSKTENQEKILRKALSAELSGVSATLQGLKDVVEANQKATLQLKKEFQDMSEQQTTQQKLFDTLHSELCDYKDDFILTRMKPIITTMIFLHDSLKSFDRELETYVEPPDWLGAEVLSKKTVSANVTHFQEQLEEIFKMCHLMEFKPETNAPADPKTQNITATLPCEDAALNNCVQEVIKSGWMQDDKLFRAAEVAIWKGA